MTSRRSTSNSPPRRAQGVSVAIGPAHSPVSPPVSFLSARRPSLTAVCNTALNQNVVLRPGIEEEATYEPISPEEEGKFRQSLQIDMKSLVGDAVGNMSISPTCRDLVLAARKGLFIIDLESPLEVPRFLPQGGTWDVADVQWNPHRRNEELVVSTSNERLLIWNLHMMGKTSIEFTLQAHYRAITDINWHNFDPDLVSSTGIDSWIWAWDLRCPEKPAFGLCAFNAGGTQVKWNRQDEHLLASSHLDEVVIWDRRKGSIPLSQTKVHDAKIYGIDWSYTRRNEIITCSLDRTIKVWDMEELVTPGCKPKSTFFSNNPVWRARDLPFGHGVLSLPQRGETKLEMWAHGSQNSSEALETFEGHTDVVKEFVWRSRGTVINEHEDLEFQLITWSKDKTLRFWPISRDVMQKAGEVQEPPLPGSRLKRVDDSIFSFRSKPIGARRQPALSAPKGQRSILAGVRAAHPSNATANPVLLPHHGSAARASFHEAVRDRERERRVQSDSTSAARSSALGRRSTESGQGSGGVGTGTMSKGTKAGKTTKMEPYAWLSGFRADSVGPSRLSSGSRPPSGPEREGSGNDSQSVVRRRSLSRVRGEEGTRETEASLLEEVNAVVARLTPAKVKLEKADFKQRTCTFGLHGPWGDSTSPSVFIRVTLTFPKDYPLAKYPGGTPQVEFERSPLITVKKRAYIKRKLREIRENQRPCLEASLRFLLHADGRGKARPFSRDSGSSSENDEPAANAAKGKKDVIARIRDEPGLSEPRSTQGVFGPNGQLICFFRSLPRLVKAVQQQAPSVVSPSGTDVSRLFQSPRQLSDAVRRLARAANDHSYGFADAREPEDAENILRIMNNLLSFTQPKARHASETSKSDMQKNFALLPNRHTIVYLRDRSFIVGAHRRLAATYTVIWKSPTVFCNENALIARLHGRTDHERLFRSLSAIVQSLLTSGVGRQCTSPPAQTSLRPLAKTMIHRLHSELIGTGDLQALAMFSVAVLELYQSLFTHDKPAPYSTQASPYPAKLLTGDYFSLRKRRDTPALSPSVMNRLPSSPVTPGHGQPLSSSLSSRGSWSSLFNAGTGTVRHLINAAQDLARENQGENAPPDLPSPTTIPVPGGGRQQKLDSAVKKKGRQDQLSFLSPPMSARTASEPSSFSSSRATGSSQSSLNVSKRPTFSQVVSPQHAISGSKARIVTSFGPLDDRISRTSDEKIAQFHAQVVQHVLAYSEMLHSWNLTQKRAQLLKALLRGPPWVTALAKLYLDDFHYADSAAVEIAPLCRRCNRVLEAGRALTCASCTGSLSLSPALCAVCRMPVKGLSHDCLACCHVIHVKCWRGQSFDLCPTGCGCECRRYDIEPIPVPSDAQAELPEE